MKYEIQTTGAYDRWFKTIKNRTATLEITARLRQLAILGEFGDMKLLGGGIGEMRMMREGYRVYFAQQGETLVFLLGGSAKKDGLRAQNADIQKAKKLWQAMKREQTKQEK